MVTPLNAPLELAQKICPKESVLKQFQKVNGAVSPFGEQNLPEPVPGLGHVE